MTVRDRLDTIRHMKSAYNGSGTAGPQNATAGSDTGVITFDQYRGPHWWTYR